MAEGAPGSVEPLIRPRDPQEEEQREPGRVRAGRRQESRFGSGCRGV